MGLRLVQKSGTLNDLESRNDLYFGAVRHEDELIIFRGQKVKGRGHNETTYGQVSIFDLSPEYMNIFHDTYHSYSLPGSHGADDIFRVMFSKVKVTKMQYSGRGIPIEDSPSKTIYLVYLTCSCLVVVQKVGDFYYCILPRSQWLYAG